MRWHGWEWDVTGAVRTRQGRARNAKVHARQSNWRHQLKCGSRKWERVLMLISECPLLRQHLAYTSLRSNPYKNIVTKTFSIHI